MAAIDLLLRASGLERHAISGAVATRGPGSFTGIRVALATAQGLVAALGIPAHGYSSLLAQARRSASLPCLAVQPARRGHVYAQVFLPDGDSMLPEGDPRVIGIDELATSQYPVVAPVGLTLPPAVLIAPTRESAAEALLSLLAAEPAPDSTTLTPIYLEPPPALPVSPRTTPWPPSPQGS